MRTLKLVMTVLAISLFVAACSNPPKVFQGTAVSYTEATKTLVAADESGPNAEMTFSLDKAEIGASPAAGDIVRISYKDEGGVLRAIRVMNLSKQKELQLKH